MPRSPLLLLALAAALAGEPVRADCELLYAPAQIRARLLAFHHANELRRAREQAQGIAGTGTTGPIQRPSATSPDRAAPATSSARPR